MAMSLAQHGSGFPFFGKSTFRYLCGEDTANIEVVNEETPDPVIRNLIKQVHSYMSIINVECIM